MHSTRQNASSTWSLLAACRGDESLKTERNLMPSSVIQYKKSSLYQSWRQQGIQFCFSNSKFNIVAQEASKEAMLVTLAPACVKFKRNSLVDPFSKDHDEEEEKKKAEFFVSLGPLYLIS